MLQGYYSCVVTIFVYKDTGCVVAIFVKKKLTAYWLYICCKDTSCVVTKDVYKDTACVVIIYVARILLYPLNLKSQNQAKNIPVGLPSSPTKIWGKSVQGVLELWSDKQSDKQRLQLYI